MPTYKLLIEYEGTRYSGWQTQSNTPKTIQGNLLRAAQQIFHDADVGGSGRTDAGVHASGQVAHLRIEQSVNALEVRRKLNDLLPFDIHVLDAQQVRDNFHSRHDAQSRIYLYQISRRRTSFGKSFVWWIKDRLDLTAMSAAASVLPGMHDFSAFTDRRSTAESSQVLVESAELGEDEELILFRISASHYLWKMVRKLVAALVETGRGTMSVEQFAALVERPKAPFSPTAPPSGLFLEAVTFDDEVFDRPLQALVPVHSSHLRRGNDGKKRRRDR